MWWNFINVCFLTFTHSLTLFCILWGSISVGRCAFLCSLLIVFRIFGSPLKGPDLERLVQPNPLIWAESDSAGWTGWEVFHVHDEWKMTLVMVLVEVEIVKMTVVCPSVDTEAH